MLWHTVSLDVSGLGEPAREALEAAIERLRQIDEIRWFTWGRDAERPGVTAFVAVVSDLAALEGYRAHPVHLDLAQAIRQSGARVHRLDLDDMPLPS